MRHLTIAERLIAAAILPMVALLAVHFAGAVLARFLGPVGANYAEAAIGLFLAGLAAVAIGGIASRSPARWPMRPIA